MLIYVNPKTQKFFNKKSNNEVYTHQSGIVYQKNIVPENSIKFKTSFFTDSNIVKHLYYSLKYSEDHEQPIWVNYLNTRETISSKKHKRKNNFREDPLVNSGSSTLLDYRNSGYDRGHLCPAADMSFSEIAISESFFMSNISPQHPSFNRGIWKKLEDRVRYWSVKYDSTIIYCGGILDSTIGTIGPNRVSVPKYFYKVIYCPKIKSALGFIFPNQKCLNSLSDYVVHVDSVETLTHVDFYNNLPLDLQNNIEKNYTLSKWF